MRVHPFLAEGVPHGGTCGRPLKTRKNAFCVNACTDGARACRSHLTDDERAALAALERDRDAWFEEQEPACWAWPVPQVPVFTSEEDALHFMYAWQDHQCAICGVPHAGITDHDHKTDRARGVLCRDCNIAEGSAVAPIYAKYRKRNPASILGIYVEWGDPPLALLEDPRDAVDKLHLPRPEDLVRGHGNCAGVPDME